eukprot:COSAG05_NODE_2142_length_3486_cov_1.351048_2_plen_26_part_01
MGMEIKRYYLLILVILARRIFKLYNY